MSKKKLIKNKTGHGSKEMKIIKLKDVSNLLNK